MRPTLFLCALALLAGCAGAPPVDNLRAQQEAACSAAIAAHIGQPASAVESRWLSRTGGVARVEAIDTARQHRRQHLCDVDADGRVLGYSHPGA